MKYLFIFVFFYAFYKLFIVKNIKDKVGYFTLALFTVILGIVNLVFEPSIADILKRWA